MLGIWEIAGIIVLILIAVKVFGSSLKKEGPEVARSAGESVKAFKEGLKDVKDTKKEITEEIKK